MKKILGVMLGLAFVATVVYAADPTTFTSLRVTGAVQLSGTNTIAGYVSTAAVAQVDTNVTTTVTGYTPSFTGQILVGGAGSGTNGVWVAKGITTNDWVRVAP
jgi:hypothetical protein